MYVIYNGEEISINEDLLRERDVGPNLMKIIETRFKIERILGEAQYNSSECSVDTINRLKELEYTLQDLWGFPRDSSYHLNQFRLRFCSCPLDDNRDRVGTGSWVLDKGCPYHGGSR